VAALLVAETPKETHLVLSRWSNVFRARTRARSVPSSMATKTTCSCGTKILCLVMASLLRIVATSWFWVPSSWKAHRVKLLRLKTGWSKTRFKAKSWLWSRANSRVTEAELPNATISQPWSNSAPSARKCPSIRVCLEKLIQRMSPESHVLRAMVAEALMEARRSMAVLRFTMQARLQW